MTSLLLRKQFTVSTQPSTKQLTCDLTSLSLIMEKTLEFPWTLEDTTSIDVEYIVSRGESDLSITSARAPMAMTNVELNPVGSSIESDLPFTLSMSDKNEDDSCFNRDESITFLFSSHLEPVQDIPSSDLEFNDGISLMSTKELELKLLKMKLKIELMDSTQDVN